MKKFIYTLASLAMILPACTTGGVQEVIKPQPEEEVEIVFSSVIDTKAIEGEFEIGDEVGIYAVNSGGVIPADIYNNYANMHFKASSKTGMRPIDDLNKMFFPADATKKLDFVSYYPYVDAAVTAGHKLSLDIANQDITVNKHLVAMYSDNAVELNKENLTVALQYKYLTSKVVVVLKPGTGLTGGNLAGTTIEVKNAKTQANVSLIDKTYADYVAGVLSGIKPANEESKLSFFLLPHGSDTGLEMIFTSMSGAKFYYSVPKEHNFEAGKVYTYTLTLNQTIVDAVVGVEDWVPGEDRGGSADQQ